LKPHEEPFAMHGSVQTDPVQAPEQQVEPVLHAPPLAVQLAGGAHAFGVPVQLPVQQSPATEQDAPFALHGAAHWVAPLQ
jgi:hypothetical protein